MSLLSEGGVVTVPRELLEFASRCPFCAATLVEPLRIFLVHAACEQAGNMGPLRELMLGALASHIQENHSAAFMEAFIQAGERAGTLAPPPTG